MSCHARICARQFLDGSRRNEQGLWTFHFDMLTDPSLLFLDPLLGILHRVGELAIPECLARWGQGCKMPFDVG